MKLGSARRVFAAQYPDQRRGKEIKNYQGGDRIAGKTQERLCGSLCEDSGLARAHRDPMKNHLGVRQRKYGIDGDVPGADRAAAGEEHEISPFERSPQGLHQGVAIIADDP